MRRTIFVVLAFVAVTSAIAILLTRRLVDRDGSGGPRALTSGSGLTLEFSDKPIPMPGLPLTDISGAPLDVNALKGKVVLVNFWATWCGPCREEMPTLVALQEHYRDQLAIIGISMDTGPVDAVKQFADEYKVNYPIAMSTPEIEEAFGGIPALPSTFFVNLSGGMVQRHMGMLNPQRTEHEVRALAGLETPASVKTVTDTGQVLLANAAYATEIPGVDLTGLTPAQKEEALKRLNTDHCTCGCGLTLAQCRINDPSCDVSPGLANAIVADIRKK